MDSFFGGGKSSSSKTTCSNPKTTPDGSTKTVASAKTDDIDMTSPVSSPISEKKPLKLSPAMELSKSINEKRSDNPHIAQISFERFAELLQQMADTTKRTIKLGALETFIREIMDTQEQGVDLTTRAHTLTSALELVLGGRTSKPLNISDSAVSKALQTSLGVSRSQLSKAYRQYGDLGDCAAGFFQKKKFFVTSSASRHLSIVQVSEALEKISVTDGRDAKQLIALSLLRKCQSKTELRFLVRLLIRFMRIGANLKTVLAALAMAVLSQGNRKKEIDAKEIKEAVAMVQKTHDICPNIGLIVCALLEGGIEQMKRDCSIQIHTPIAPMLAHPIHTMEEVEKAMRTDGCTSAVMEYKYDGMRLQAHYDGNSVKLFSRHMLETTSQFAEVAQYLIEAFKVKGTTNASFIIDAEVVGVEESGDEMNLLPFQELATRRKKNDDGKGVRVKVFVFDLMFLDGISLINEPLHKRQNLLVERFQGTSNFAFVTHQNLASFDENKILKFLTESVEHGAEGIMIKLQETGTSYEAGTRSHSWLKVKRDYVMGFADTIDVVPIGAWYGNGRKAQKSFLSPVLLAVYDDQEDVSWERRKSWDCIAFADACFSRAVLPPPPPPPSRCIDLSAGV
jgi:DNA ligase-1